jgi:hypothetical protein
MMRDFYDWDTTPYEVEGQMLGSNYDPIKAREEARETIKLLCRKFGVPPAGSLLKVHANPHDFGSYYSIRFIFNDADDDHLEYLNRVENNWPKDWDDSELVAAEQPASK